MMATEVHMDDLFNHEAAQWAHDVVMKLDDDAVEPFVRAVVHDTLHWDLAANRRTIDNHVREVNKSLLEDITRTVSKNYAAPLEIAESLVVEISKAFGNDPYNRDESGRFATVESRVRTSSTQRPLPKKRERESGIPSAKRVAAASGSKGRKLSPRERAAYQQQYTQLTEALDRFSSMGAKDVSIVIEDKRTGRRRSVKAEMRGDIPVGWNPAYHNIVSVRAETPSGRTLTDASFDLVSALGSGAGSRTEGVTRGVSQGGNQFAERWTDASRDNVGTNDRTYRRVAAGSKLLGEVAPNSPKAQVASQFGQFVGEYGPQAEKVIGPRMRKTAYRYRGTEKTPDRALTNSHSTMLKNAGLETMGANPEQAAALAQQAASHHLMEKLPSPKLAEIQRKSGKIPPSQGVIINSDGKIVTQAVGYADDHYLPFNLKNLKGLKGGHYVRTRSMGGLTTEDIYTGLVSGARSVSVVSNSGIFTVNFSDDLRGARRHNDKAAGMVDRYAKTLDAIKNGQIERKSLDPETKAAIRDEIEAEYEGQSYPGMRAEIEERVEEAVRDYRATPQLTTKELEYIDARARQGAKDDRDYRRTRSELIDQAMEDKRSRFYQLDGEGYGASMEALREQYPYYIDSVNFITRRGLFIEGQRNDPDAPPNALQRKLKDGADRGYVKPRHNRPDDVLDGYFDAEISGEGEIRGTGKTRASHTNYQNWEHNPVRGRRAAPARESEESTPAVQATGNSRQDVRQKVAQADARMRVETGHKTQLQGIVNTLTSRTDLPETGYETLKEAAKDYESVYSDRNKREKLEREVEDLYTDLSSQEEGSIARRVADGLRDKMDALKVQAGRLGGVQYSSEEHLGRDAASPYAFAEPAYQLGAKHSEHAAEVSRQERIARQSGLTVDISVEDEKLRAAATSAGQLARVLGSGRIDDDAYATLVRLGREMGRDLTWAEREANKLRDRPMEEISREAERWARVSQAMERLRRLKVTTPESATPDRQVTAERARTPEQMSAEEAVGLLGNVANQLGDNVLAGDYRDMATLLRRGNRQEALNIAQIIDDPDETRQHLLERIFGDDLNPFNDR